MNSVSQSPPFNLVGLILLIISIGSTSASDKVLDKYANEPIQPVSHDQELNQQLVSLGRSLFSDPRLSANNSISCTSCHILNRAGVDGLQFSPGVDGAPGKANTPTIYNSGLNFVQLWDGAAQTLEEQAGVPIQAQHEMASSWPQVIAKLEVDREYQQKFSRFYSDGITAESISNALATYAASLLTPNSRFDRFLKGEENAISKEEVRGYTLFKSYGCSSCHQGVAVGGNLYQKMGVLGDYFADRNTELTQEDYGRFNVTGNPEHKFQFKVPGLRNVALTAPYFHDGSIQTLPEAVEIMAKYQLGRPINSEDLKLIISFLNTLTGEMNP